MRKKSSNRLLGYPQKATPAKGTFTRPHRLAEKQISSPPTIVVSNEKAGTPSISPPARASSLSSKGKMKKGGRLFDYAHEAGLQYTYLSNVNPSSNPSSVNFGNALSHPTYDKRSAVVQQQIETLSIASRQFDIRVQQTKEESEESPKGNSLSEIIQCFGGDQPTPPSMENISMIEKKPSLREGKQQENSRGDDTILGMLRDGR